MSLQERWHEELQSAWIYERLAKTEPHPRLRQLFLDLSGAARAQASILEGDARALGKNLPSFRPSWRARGVSALAGRLGAARTRSMLSALKVRGLSAVDVLLQSHEMPTHSEEIGARHRRGGASLRATVFGVNDGLVSNTSLVLGMAGATQESSLLIATGIAGMLAGAFSMAAGEYISVRSQRELYEFQIGEEAQELERYPQAEAEELALIYAARGVDLEQARAMTAQLVLDKTRALDTLAREELGLNPNDLGSPWLAASSSFFAFLGGALVPLLPFVLGIRTQPLLWTCGFAGLSLFAVGSVLSLFSGKNAVYGGLRMLSIGALAGLATYGIGRLLGVSIS